MNYVQKIYFSPVDVSHNLYRLALTFLDNVGDRRAKKLIAYCGGVEAFFAEPKKNLAKIPDFGKALVSQMDRDAALRMAEKELKFVEKSRIRLLFYLDKEYPKRLKHCEDGPILLYAKGEMSLNAEKTVSIIGTRNASDYGRRVTEQIVAGLVPHGALVVSGLAYGIDIIAHQAALKNGLQTVGVMGNSLDRVYPPVHQKTVEKMALNGGVLSEFPSGTKPDRENFPQRNRIVAGMADATIVVETALKGGSMITARLAGSYNRDVLAVPGRTEDPYSSGCNHLIKTNQAALMETMEDLEYLLGWDRNKKEKPVQKQMFVDVTEEEKPLLEILQTNGNAALDDLSLKLDLPVSKVSALLLELEFKGVVRSLPGKVYAMS